MFKNSWILLFKTFSQQLLLLWRWVETMRILLKIFQRVTVVHDSRYSLNENFKTRKKRCTDENRNVWCRICESQALVTCFFQSCDKQCLRSTLVTLFFSFCKLRFEAIISLISLQSVGDARDIVDWNVDSRTDHCESWNDRSKCNKREDLRTKIQRTTKT